MHLAFDAGAYGDGGVHCKWDEVRFLTKMTGRNAAAGVAGTVASLESKLKNLDNIIKEVKKEAVAATSRATAANNAAEDAKKSITKLYQANTTLKK